MLSLAVMVTPALAQQQAAGSAEVAAPPEAQANPAPSQQQVATPPGTVQQQQANASGVREREAESPATASGAAAGGPLAASPIPASPDVLHIALREMRTAPVLNPVVQLAAAAHPTHIAVKYDVNKIGDRNIGKGFDLYSLQKEEMLGKQLAQQVEQDSRLLKDPVVTEYINRVAQNLVRNSDARVPFTVKVIDNDEVNAFALPGGFFFVNTGLILAAENEAELAGVMAHEIAHVAARHATKNMTRAQVLDLASIPLIFVGGPAGYVARQALGLAVPLSFLKFSRNDEREADLLGLEYEYVTGYDPEEFVRFFEKLKLQEKQKHNFMARAFATHPMTGERIKRAQEEIEKYLPPRNEYIVDTSEFEQIKARLKGMENEHRIDNGKRIQPTLRRRPPEDSGSKGKDGPPVLRRPGQ